MKKAAEPPQDNTQSSKKETRQSFKKAQENQILQQSLPSKIILKKSRKSISTKSNVVFGTQNTPEQIENKLFILFDQLFPKAINDINVISDLLSVQNLRIIVRILNLCTVQDLSTFRKTTLCEKLQKHFQTEHMHEMYEKFLRYQEKIKEEKQKEHELKQQQKKRKEEEEKLLLMAMNEEEEDDSIPDPLEKDEVYQHGNIKKVATPSRIKVQHSEPKGKKVEIPRLIYDDTFDATKAVNFLKIANNFVLEVSERINEMERAVSIMSLRLAELENLYK
ncbi:hypothetical protein GPJ56_000128 [Histomonas meleagridis]|uniref:uncharacterized protein n=1 Tax=Histomonas meleagridis TaxID=135588 RepID=UPI00355AB727|nr:hypothetical protein GPJ56_000128 [Histomonas meleagridis]KAH0805627.1 hypothetical protein GO595_001682 [Histomonas meleagridis]